MLSLPFGSSHNYTDKAAKVGPLSWNIMSKLSQNKTVAEAKDKKQNKLLQVDTRQSEPAVCTVQVAPVPLLCKS